MKSHLVKEFFFKTFKPALLLLIILISTRSTHAQFFERLSNPTILVNIKHPPTLGFKISKVSFVPTTGECADQITDAIQSDFVANKVEVSERESINRILEENHFTNSNLVDPSNRITLGKLLGPTILIFIKVNQCRSEQDRVYGKEEQYDSKTKTNYYVMAYYARTRAFLTASVKAVDLATGRNIGEKQLEYSPEKKNKSYEGYPEYPATFDVSQIASNMMVQAVHQMFLPWFEQRDLIYYDDNKGGLKQAFQALKAGDLDQAFELSKQNIETCKSMPKANDKLLEHAYYNLGMSYMIRDDYDKALENFKEALKIKPGEILTKAIADCQKAIALSSAMKQIDQKAAFDANQKQAENDKIQKKEEANTLTNTDIIKLAKMKLSEGIIIKKIKLSKCNFDTSADALSLLTKSGVTEKIVMAMMEKPQ